MTTTEQEIASAAARRSAGMRRRVRKACPVCGTEFEGLTTRRFCSARCRTRAARTQMDDADMTQRQPPPAPRREARLTDEDMIQRPGEDIAQYLARIRHKAFGDRVSDIDAVELIRQEREARSDYLASLSKR